MTIRERVLAVYGGRVPDCVPCMLDLSHWFYHRNGRPWDISRPCAGPDQEMLDLHKRYGVGFYVGPIIGAYSVEYAEGVTAEVRKGSSGGVETITWRLRTPMGDVERTRIWEEDSYSWGIREWGVKSERDLAILAHALSSRTFVPRWEKYQAWADCAGEDGVVYMSSDYSAMGHLLCLWMGIEGTIHAIMDWPETMRDFVERVNRNRLGLVDIQAASPAEVVIMGDNFSSDIQPPRFFNEWSRPFYAEAIRRLHSAGKRVAVHIDGRLKGLLRAFQEIGADCSDATTPAPMGDLTPLQCRDEAGPRMILSGGVPPTVWLPNAPTEDFVRCVMDWLELRKRSPALIAAAGDQVPPHAVEDRIKIMRDLVEKHGRY